MSSDSRQLETLRQFADRSPYPLEAFVFVLNGLVFARQHVQYDPEPPYQRGGHLDAVDICWCLHDYAVVAFGNRAREQLKRWHIERTEDFGQVLYGLIDCNLANKLEQDSLQDFAAVFDFDQQFQEPNELTIVEPAPTTEGPLRRYPQFSLRWLLCAILVVAIALGWFTYLWRHAQHQQAAVTGIVRSGGTVIYERWNGTQLPLLQQLFGIDFANDVRAVAFLQGVLTTDNIGHVTRLTNVDWIMLSQVNDPSVLGQLHLLSKLRTVILTGPGSDKLLENLLVGAPRLEVLHIRHPELSDHGMRYVGQLKNLRELSIQSDALTDAGVREFGNLKSLRQLQLLSSNVQGESLREISTLTDLEQLHLQRAPLRAESLTYLASLGKLQLLDLRDSAVTDEGLVHLSMMSQLKQLNLSATQITEAGLGHLKTMQQLKYLQITCPQLSTASIHQLQEQMPKTRVIDQRIEMEKLMQRAKEMEASGAKNEG